MAEEAIASQVLSFKYRLMPNKRQHDVLNRILEDQRVLYNAALEERIDAFRKCGKSITLYAQQKSLTLIRRECIGWADFPANLQRGTLKRLDEAFQGFFRRLKVGSKAGFPRFKGTDRFRSFEFIAHDGMKFDGKRIRFKGLPGGLRVHLHRPLPDGPYLSAKFFRDAKGWNVCFIVRVPCQTERELERSVGIDLGITTLAALSNGDLVTNPCLSKKAERKIRIRQRALSRCKIGSKRRGKVKAHLAKVHLKVVNSRLTYLHQVSKRLTTDYDLLAIENLNVKGMAASMLAKSVADAGWSLLTEMLRYKAESAGAKLIEVDSSFTSQTCPNCGIVAKKSLKEREHRCDCGCVLDRDVAAARVILHRAVARPGFANAA